MPLEYTYSFLILLQILPKGHDGESSPACCAPENACHRLRARPAPPPDEVPSRAALLNPPPRARPLCGAPGPSVRCAETRRSRLAALRRNEICMRGIPVQNKGGTASFASSLFGGGGAFLFVFARTRKAPPQGAPEILFFPVRGASLPPWQRIHSPPALCGRAGLPARQTAYPPPPARMTRRSAPYTGTHNTSIHIHTHPYTATVTHNTSTHPHTLFVLR